MAIKTPDPFARLETGKASSMRQINRRMWHLVPIALIGIGLGCGTMPPSKPTKPPSDMPEKHMTKEMMKDTAKDQKGGQHDKD
jgi:hypothetical protein